MKFRRQSKKVLRSHNQTSVCMVLSAMLVQDRADKADRVSTPDELRLMSELIDTAHRHRFIGALCGDAYTLVR